VVFFDGETVGCLEGDAEGGGVRTTGLFVGEHSSVYGQSLDSKNFMQQPDRVSKK